MPSTLPITRHSWRFNIKQLDQDQGTFVGYATVFDHVDSDRDVFVRGAFSKFLATNRKKQVKLLWQHDSSYPIGHFTTIKEDDYGLLVAGRLLLELPKAREAYFLLKNGIVDAMSLGFTISKDKLDRHRKVRLIEEAELWEISLVTFPANSEARIRDVKAKTSWQFLIEEIKRATSELA